MQYGHSMPVSYLRGRGVRTGRTTSVTSTVATSPAEEAVKVDKGSRLTSTRKGRGLPTYTGDGLTCRRFMHKP